MFINLLYTYTMPINHYCSTYMTPYPHLMAKHCLEVGTISRSEAWNLPTWGCKSMMDGLTIMLEVFINLLYTYTMPINHYCSTYMMPYHHLMAKHCLEVSRKSRFTFAWYLRHETCLHGAVKVWWMDLQSCWECSSTYYTPIQCQTTTIVAPTWVHTPTWWPNIAWKSAENQDLRHETCLHGAVNVGWMDLQSFWECSSTCYTPVQCQSTTIVAPTWCHTPTWWPKHCLEVGRISRSDEAWNLPTWCCKSMMDGLTIMLGVFINLLYTYTTVGTHQQYTTNNINQAPRPLLM